MSNRQKERESEERREKERREAEAQERQRVRDAEAEERQKQREHDLALANIRNEELRGLRGEVEGSVGLTIVAKSPPKIDVPKFENNVAKYLDLFEKVMQQNQYDETVWPLDLRTTVVGSKLEALVSMGGTYEEIKKEVHAFSTRSDC